jgi:hypothetical protein
VVQEGVLTDTQRQMFFRQLVDLKNLGEPIPPLMLTKAAPLQGKSELIVELEAYDKAQQQAAAKQQQDTQALLETQSNYNKAKAISEIANAKEHFTRAVANLGLEDERVSSAVEDRAQATLARTKAIKELQGMDDDRILKYWAVIRGMEESNKRKEDEIKQDDVQLASVAETQATPQPDPAASLQSVMGNFNKTEVPNGQI